MITPVALNRATPLRHSRGPRRPDADPDGVWRAARPASLVSLPTAAGRLCHDPRMSRAKTIQPRLRVGDAERDACVAALIEHHLHGRLSVDELDRRQRSALAAVTDDDFRPLLADLPLEGASSTTAAARTSQSPGKVGLVLLGMSPLLGGAFVAQAYWQHSAAGPFLGILLGGALGYATHAATSRSRH